MKNRTIQTSSASLLAFGALLLVTAAHADSPNAAPNPAAKDTPIPGTKGTVYGDLPVGTFSDDYQPLAPPKKIAPLPSHVVLRTSDGMTTLQDAKNTEGFSPRTPQMSCFLNNHQLQPVAHVSADGGSPHAIRSLRVDETPSGDAQLLTDSILLRGGMPAGSIHHGVLPLKKLQTLEGGLVLFGARDEREGHRMVHFVVRPAPSPFAMFTQAQHTTAFFSTGQLNMSSGCGFIHVAIPVAKGTANTAQVRVNAIVPSDDPSAANTQEGDTGGDNSVVLPTALSPRTTGGPGKPFRPVQQDIALRPIAIGLSVSQLGSDPEPRVTFAAAWKGDEVTQRVFVPQVHR